MQGHVEDETGLPSIFWSDTSVTALVAPAGSGPLHEAVRLHGPGDLTRTYGDVAASPLGLAVGDFFVNGGRVAIAVRAEDGHAGIAALRAADAFQLLTLDPSFHATALEAAYSLCSERHALMVVDADENGRAPGGLGADAAVYYPRLADALGNTRPCAPAVAGVMARNDADRGVWRSPAGSAAVVRGAAGVAKVLGERDLGELNRRQVNGLRLMPDGSLVVWGARTASADPDWKYVAIRRLRLFLEQTIGAGLRWTVFETDGEALWEEVRHEVEDFLARLWREGAFPGSRPQEAFVVRCDRTTMTEADIEAGRLVCIVGFAPIRPGEFSIFTISRTAAAPHAPPRPA